MNKARSSPSALGPDGRALCRVGGVSAIVLGVCYVVIVALYARAGAVPSGSGGAWLRYLEGRHGVWWGIAALSVLTDVLFLPLAAALYVALRRIDSTRVLAGATLLALFAVLDLAVTWPNYASLLVLSGDQAAAATEIQRAASVAAATYPAAVLRSTLFAVYAILVPALGILAISTVMFGSPFGRAAAVTGVATGLLGVVSVAGPLVWDPLGAFAIPTSVLTTAWVLMVGSTLVTRAATL